jgi:peptidyl-prolyl cis-trans isomerase B (cyclophilin B)
VASSKHNEREAREARERLRRYNARQAVHENQSKRRARDNWFALGGVVVIAALATVTQIFYFAGGPGTPTPEPTASDAPVADGVNVGDIPAPSVSENRLWTGELDLNSTVTLGIELDGGLAPQGVASFVTSVYEGYYIDKTCHRLVQSASAGLLQCGSLDGTGASDPSYSFGPIENAPADGIYPVGTIALARAGNDAYSQGRQFFIVFDESTLPADNAGGYTIIGRVTSGLDLLVSEIADGGMEGQTGDGPPVVPTSITRLTIQ